MAGAGFKTFNTGDVLTASDVNTYLMQQTVMVFADSSARTTALGANVAEGMLSYLKDTNATEVYDGSSWVSIGASGDITGVTAGAGLSGGGTSGSVTLSLGSTAAGRNAIINGGFDVWQRGTSFSSDINKYTADRWMIYRGVTTSTISRQATSDTTNLPNLQYCLRFQRNSGSTSTNTSYLSQSFESVNSIPFAGQTIVFSFYARKGADFSAASSQILVKLAGGTGTDQNVISGSYTGNTAIINSTATLTTTWQRFTYTASVGATITELNPYFQWDSVGTAGTNDYVEITGVQLELGSSPSPFSRAGGTIQGELAACQRYYQKSYEQGTAPATNTQTPGVNWSIAPTSANNVYIGTVIFPVLMRTAPTVTIYSYTSSNTGRVSDMNGTDLAAGSGTVYHASQRNFVIQNNSGGSITAAIGGFIFHHVASAEL